VSGAHRSDRIVGIDRHRFEEPGDVFLGVAESLLALEQSTRFLDRIAQIMVDMVEVLELVLRLVEPFFVRMRIGELCLELLILDDAACSRSISSMRPGWSRHLRMMSASAKGSTPLSDAMHTRSSLVTHQRAGRRPLRSSVAPIWRPSVKATAAGPSHGSINAAWYS